MSVISFVTFLLALGCLVMPDSWADGETKFERKVMQMLMACFFLLLAIYAKVTGSI